MCYGSIQISQRFDDFFFSILPLSEVCSLKTRLIVVQTVGGLVQPLLHARNFHWRNEVVSIVVTTYNNIVSYAHSCRRKVARILFIVPLARVTLHGLRFVIVTSWSNLLSNNAVLLFFDAEQCRPFVLHYSHYSFHIYTSGRTSSVHRKKKKTKKRH